TGIVPEVQLTRRRRGGSRRSGVGTRDPRLQGASREILGQDERPSQRARGEPLSPRRRAAFDPGRFLTPPREATTPLIRSRDHFGQEGRNDRGSLLSALGGGRRVDLPQGLALLTAAYALAL